MRAASSSLWSVLRIWICGGNFNEILSFGEKIGGSDRVASAILSFQFITLSDCDLHDIGYSM